MNMRLNRRNVLLSMFASGAGLASLPQRWTKPLVNAVVAPAHAQTSCSGFEVEPIDQPIDITLTADEVRGPIIANRDGSASFNDTQTLTNGTCNNGAAFSQEVTFSGTIDLANNQITGDLLIRQFCGDDLFCEQVSTYTAQQMPADASTELGTYQGRVIGTQTCCVDFF